MASNTGQALSTDPELIIESLEWIAERHSDLVPLVYGRFYTHYPDARTMFGRDEHRVHQGHMFNGMLMAVIEHAEGRCAPGSIDAWVIDHDLWGVKKAMYRVMFDALHETIRECMGERWNASFSKAWETHIYGLADEFEQACDKSRLGT